MNIRIMCTLAVAALAVAGCGRKDDGAAAAQKPAETKAAEKAVDKNAVMVSVDGKKLTRGVLDADVEKLLAARKGQIPAEQVEEARKAFGERLASMFLQKTLLLNEAEKKGVKLSDADFKKSVDDLLKKIASQPGAPKTLDELIEKGSPFGKERGLQELKDNFLIQKLLEQEVSSKIKVDPAKVEEQLKKLADANAEAAKKALDAEAKIKTLAKQLEGLKGEALAKKFAELAKANSECPSKEKGGDLGEFTHGQMVKEFDEVAFKQEVNTVSAPVKTQFGWHLVMPTKKIPAVEAKGDKPASPEKVQASHILVMARAPQPVPAKADIEKRMKGQEEQTAMRTFMEGLRVAAKIEAPGYPQLVPPPAKPAVPKKVVESKPVEVKPAQAKPAAPKKVVESKPAQAKPAEAKPAQAKPAEAKKVVESKPAQAKPAEAKPAEAKK